MAFTPQFLDELRDRVGLAAVIGRRVRLTRKGREHTGLCPFHKEKTPSFTVNEEKGFYHCFGCGEHGGVFDFLMKAENLSFKEVVEMLTLEAGPSLISSTSPMDFEDAIKIKKIEALQDCFVRVATTGIFEDDTEYRHLRKELLASEFLKKHMPKFVRDCRNLFQFWEYIKHKFGTYAERREYIWDAFRPILDALETQQNLPFYDIASEILREFDEEYVYKIWQRAIVRRGDDPEGAITISRTLLETICKHILDDMGIKYPANANLPKLYKFTAEALNLAPSQHTESTFKSILGGCQTIVNNLGTLRNRISDAHGHGRRPVKPGQRHADLAVNLAGTMAVFLVSTWKERRADLAA